MKHEVLLYVPNVICYVRLALIATSALIFTLMDYANVQLNILALLIYILSAFLDMFDGYCARRLGQESAFGAWLDVVVDLIGRTMMWHIANIKIASFVLPCVDWLCFCCSHASWGLTWKQQMTTIDSEEETKSANSVVSKVFSNGFYSFYGALALTGLDGLPVTAVMYSRMPELLTGAVSQGVLYVIFAFLISCQILASYCCLYIIANYLTTRLLLEIKLSN